MSKRVEILRALVREELLRQRKNSEASLREMIRFANMYAIMGNAERARLEELASRDARVTFGDVYEDINIIVSEVQDEDDDDIDDLHEIPPSI